MVMDRYQLRYFLAIVEIGNVSRVAERLYLRHEGIRHHGAVPGSPA